MFTIDLLMVHGQSQPVTVDTVASLVQTLAEANKSARSLLERERGIRQQNAPDAYQIRNSKGVVVFRSWTQDP